MSKKAILLLIVNGLYSLALGLSKIFVNIFLWKQSNNFVLIATYNLMHYVFSSISFIIAGWLSKKKNGIWPLRLGITIFSLFFIAILLMRNQVIDYYILFGIVFGIALGFYWLAFNVLSFDFTTTNNRDTFNGYNGCIAGIANAITPIIAAYIIEKNEELTGYTIVFAISLFLFVILILVSLLLKSEHYGEKLDYTKIFNKDNKEWHTLRKAIAFWGLRDVVIIFLINILIFRTTKSEVTLGNLTLMAYLISSISYVLEQKFIKPKLRWISFHIGSIFMFLAVIGFSFDISLNWLLTYIIIDAVFMPFFFIPMTSATFNIIDQKNEKKMRTEYIINREFALNTGRTISTTILIAFLIFIDNDRILNYFLLFIGSSQLFSILYLRKLKVWKQ